MSLKQETRRDDTPSIGKFARLKAMAPQIFVVVLFLLGLYALHWLLTEVHLRDVLHQMAAIPTSSLAAAALTTIGSYATLVGYDWSP